MTQLGLSVLPSLHETATSWVSRLAARNGATYVQDFVLDMGLNWQRVISGDQETLTEMSTIAGACPSTVLAFAKRTLPNRDTFIGPVPVGTKFCQNNIMSICPVCVSDWMGENGQLTEGAKVWWQAVSIRSCTKHRTQLLNLPPPRMIFVKITTSLAGSQIIVPKYWLRRRRPSQHQKVGTKDTSKLGLPANLTVNVDGWMTSRFRRSAIFAMRLA